MGRNYGSGNLWVNQFWLRKTGTKPMIGGLGCRPVCDRLFLAFYFVSVQALGSRNCLAF